MHAILQSNRAYRDEVFVQSVIFTAVERLFIICSYFIISVYSIYTVRIVPRMVRIPRVPGKQYLTLVRVWSHSFILILFFYDNIFNLK